MEPSEPLAGIAAADAHLGRPFPLPIVALPLVRWVEVRAVGDGAEVEFNLDDSRPGSPGRLAVFAGPTPPGSQLTADARATTAPGGLAVRHDPLGHAQPSLRPVTEVSWSAAGLHLRVTAQGPWAWDAVLAVVAAISPEGVG